jgi:hypothetical protein
VIKLDLGLKRLPPRLDLHSRTFECVSVFWRHEADQHSIRLQVRMQPSVVRRSPAGRLASAGSLSARVMSGVLRDA